MASQRERAVDRALDYWVGRGVLDYMKSRPEGPHSAARWSVWGGPGGTITLRTIREAEMLCWGLSAMDDAVKRGEADGSGIV